MKKIKKIILLISISLLFLTGCGGASYDSVSGYSVAPQVDLKSESSMIMNGFSTAAGVTMDYATMDDVVMEEAVIEDGYIEESKVTLNKESSKNEKIEQEISNERKLIKTVNLSIQTKAFDNFISNIGDIVDKYSGYIESSETDGIDFYNSYSKRNAYYTVRVPQNKLDEFLTNVNDLGTISYKSENTEDVTLNYYDTQSQKEALEVEQERLMDILEGAETIEQIIALEQRLSQVRYEINSLGSTLRLLDNKVDYSTVYIDVREVELEVKVEVDKGVFETIKENWAQNIINLRDFFENLIIDMTSNLGTIILEIVIVIGFIIIRKKTKKRKLKKEKDKEEKDNN